MISALIVYGTLGAVVSQPAVLAESRMAPEY